MTDEVTHEGNQTPDVSDDDIKRMDADTEQNPEPGAGAGHGPGSEGVGGGGDIPESGATDPKGQGAGNQQVKDPKESAGE